MSISPTRVSIRTFGEKLSKRRYHRKINTEVKKCVVSLRLESFTAGVMKGGGGAGAGGGGGDGGIERQGAGAGEAARMRSKAAELSITRSDWAGVIGGKPKALPLDRDRTLYFLLQAKFTEMCLSRCCCGAAAPHSHFLLLET